MVAKVCTPPSTLTVAPLDTTCQCVRRGHRHVERGFEVGLVEAREHPLGVSGFELRVQIHLAVDRVDESVQALAGVRVAAVGVDHDDVVFGQAAQRDTGRLVVAGHVEFAAVEGRAAHGAGGDVDDGVGAGEGVERHGRDGAERALARFAVAVGEIQVDPVVVDGDQRGALDGLVTGEVGECHVSNLGDDRPQGGDGAQPRSRREHRQFAQRQSTPAAVHWTAATRVVLVG